MSSRSEVAGSVSSRGCAGGDVNDSGNPGISIMRKPAGSVSAWPLIKGRGALAPLDYYYAPGCAGWAGGINSGNRLDAAADRCHQML